MSVGDILNQIAHPQEDVNYNSGFIFELQLFESEFEE